MPTRHVLSCTVVVGLALGACRDRPADIKPAAQDVTATRRSTSASPPPPGALVTLAASSAADACRCALGVDSITFADDNASPQQTNYPEVYRYWIAAVAGPCPPTQVDITVTGPQLVGGVRAQLKPTAAGTVELLADPQPRDPERPTWTPEVKRGQLLGTVTLRDGRAAQLMLPKLSGPNSGLPVYHPETQLSPEDGS